MDWWPTGCIGPGVTDINHMEVGIFDPWTNCDELDINNIIQQASGEAANQNGVKTAAIKTVQSACGQHQAVIRQHPPTCDQHQPTLGPHQQAQPEQQVGPTAHQITRTGQNQKQPAAQRARRCRHITDYVLAEEEKRLLIKEGYTDFPMICQARPLSKSEERILRKIRRKIRNKKSAQCSRQRKKEYVEDLERKYAAALRENEELKQLIDRVQHEHLYQDQSHHQQQLPYPQHSQLPQQQYQQQSKLQLQSQALQQEAYF